MFEEGLQQPLIGCRVFDRVDDFPFEVDDIMGYEVGQVGRLGMTPHLFDRGEFRGLRRQVFNGDTLAESRCPSLGGRSVSRQAIHDQDDPLGKTAAHPADERLDFVGADVVIADGQVQPQPPTLRRNGERGNDRQPIVPVPAMMDRRLPARRQVRRTTG